MKSLPLLDEDDDGDMNLLGGGIVGIVVICILKIFWQGCIPFSLFEVWSFGKKTTIEGIIAGWPVYLWGGIITFISVIIAKRSRGDPEEIIVKGTMMSVYAGIVEEILFRWWIFYFAIFFTWLISIITCGLIGWLYTLILIPVADFFTLGYMTPYLYNTDPKWGWWVPAAIISANADFRNAHKYLGVFGYINSWFGGMFLFMIMFEYGLLAAICVHFIYNQIIFSMLYLDACSEREKQTI